MPCVIMSVMAFSSRDRDINHEMIRDVGRSSTKKVLRAPLIGLVLLTRLGDDLRFLLSEALLALSVARRETTARGPTDDVRHQDIRQHTVPQGGVRVLSISFWPCPDVVRKSRRGTRSENFGSSDSLFEKRIERRRQERLRGSILPWKKALAVLVTFTVGVSTNSQRSLHESMADASPLLTAAILLKGGAKPMFKELALRQMKMKCLRSLRRRSYT